MFDFDEVRGSFPEDEVPEEVIAFARFLRVRESLPHAVNVERLCEFEEAYRLLKDIFKGDSSVRITARPFEPYMDSGSIDIEAEDYWTLDVGRLARAIGLAHDVEITSLTNGKAQLTLGFVGLSNIIYPERRTQDGKESDGE